MTLKSTLAAWFDAESLPATDPASLDRVDWVRMLPFLVLHLGCLGVWWVGVSPAAVSTCVALYVTRMFAVTAFYHRYFSHRAFATSRVWQFVFAVIAVSSAQRGPLWWAGHHRHHHVHSDTDADVHPPARGFLWSHMLWFFTRRHYFTNADKVRDFAAFPELRWLDRFDTLVPLGLALALSGLGALLANLGVRTSAGQMLVWGFCISTVVLFHATSTINSLAHRVGTRPFPTHDTSRNSFWLALLTFGEGWHNNHHRYPVSARQGFRWWEVDLTYYGLRVLAALGIIRDLRPVPAELRGRAVDRAA